VANRADGADDRGSMPDARIYDQVNDNARHRSSLPLLQAIRQFSQRSGIRDNFSHGEKYRLVRQVAILHGS
jgi:hypothetical protein